MRHIVAVLLLFVLVGCEKAPPVHESSGSLQPPAPPTTSPAVPPIAQASWFDTFNRPDGPLGEGWDMRGHFVDQSPLPPAADGFIRNNAYSYAGNDVVYAVHQFPGSVQRIGAVGRWHKARRGTSDTTIAMATVGNSLLTVTDMVHFAVARSKWDLAVRRQGGDFEPVASGEFSPPLAINRRYQFELEVAPDSVTVRVPGHEQTANVNTDGLVGDTAFWAQHPTETPASVVFDYDTVWAAVRDKPLQPVLP
jgi:hypothetical protein